MATGSSKAVYAALSGTLGIAVIKFVAAVMTGSASMWWNLNQNDSAGV